MVKVEERTFDGALPERLLGRPKPGTRLYWLGQAGFVVECGGRRLVIDPYLSDSLAEKYRGKALSHERMMAAPTSPDGLGQVDLVLSTHQHTDHMDPATLKPLFAARPSLYLVAPAAARNDALDRSGLAEDRLLLMDAGERIEPLPGLFVTATRAAHETVERDAAGRHRFLGYLIEADGFNVWHSGDCVPFDGLIDEVRALSPDVVLLPVNGRRPELTRKGIAGNFSIVEAVEIARTIGAGTMIAHHYGLFAFNTADTAEIDRFATETASPRVLRAQTGIAYELRRQTI